MTITAAKVALVVLRLIARLPIPFIRALSIPVASLLYWLAAPRRHVTLTNLALCFPHWTQAERTRVAKGHFRSFVITLFERFVFWYGEPKQVRQLCQLEGLEHIDAVLDGPVIVLAPHFVGMDAGGMRYNMQAPLASMYQRQKSALLTETMTQGRGRFGGRLILKSQGVRAAVRVLRDRIPFYFLPDMDLGPRDALFIPFFGVPAATVASVARMARLTKAKVVPCVTTLTDSGYLTRFYPAWEDFPGDDDSAATLRMNQFIEERVRETPEQYLWSHKRFKTRPEGEPGVY